MPPPILPDQESGLNEGSSELEETIKTFCDEEEGAENGWDIDSILSGTRTDGDCSGTEGRGDGKSQALIDRYLDSEGFFDWFHSDWTWDHINSFYSSGTDEMQGTKYCEDIDSIIGGTNTDGCSENEAISHVFKSVNTVQTPGIIVSENGEGLKRNSWKNIGSARKHDRSVSGALRAGNQHMGSVPKPNVCTRSSFLPLGVSSDPDYSTTLNSGALSADLSMEGCNRNSQYSPFTSSPLPLGNYNLMVGESLPTLEANRSSFTGEGNTVHSAPDMSLKETTHHIGHNVADQREAHSSKSDKASEKDTSYDSISQHFGKSLDDARKSFGVSRTAFKTMCRDVGITRWKYGKRNMGRDSCKMRRRLNDEVPGERNVSSGMPPVQDTPVVAHTSRDLNKMTVKATYNGVHIRFKLPYLSGKSELEDNVIKRLHLERNTFTIKYQDDDCEWVLIACDEDVQECIEISRSSGKTIIKMLIDRPNLVI